MRFTAISGLFTLLGCTPSIHLQVLEPSAITVPPHIQQVAFVDRSMAQGVGEGVLGVVEGLVTGENPGQDYKGREAAAEAIAQSLQNSPRFELVELGTIQPDSGILKDQIGWRAAKKTCERAGCQGLIALERFDSDSHVEITAEPYTEIENGQEVHKKRWQAHDDTRVETSWRFYDVEQKRVLHQLTDHTTTGTWDRTGASEQEAREALPNPSNTVRGLAIQAGHHYGRLVAPTYITVSRAFFVRGHPLLRSQKNRIKAGAWESAEADWRQVLQSDAKAKARARAAHNLAINQEAAGNLDAALALARNAAILWPKGRIGQYVRILETRQQKAEDVAAQMSPAEQPAPEPEPETEEPAPPPTEAEPPAPEEPEQTGPTMGPPPR